MEECQTIIKSLPVTLNHNAASFYINVNVVYQIYSY